MKYLSRLIFPLLAAAVAVPQTVLAAKEFSADTVESHPQYGDRNGHLYMGTDRMRTDFDMNGEKIIQIIDLGKQQAVIINPSQHSFMRRQANGPELQKSAAGNKPGNPCENMQNLDCKDGGPEKINGRPAHKWSISQAGQKGSMTFWLDEQRRIPIKQEMPDGSSMEMRMTGRESVNGRSTEKWEISSHSPNGETMNSLQWYDPELNINIREEQPGGYSRNLTNIKLGKQPDDLFSVPAGYTEQTMPQQPVQ